MTEAEVAEILEEVATRPRSAWQQALDERFADDPSLARQALILLHANRTQSGEQQRPNLGAGNERFRLEVLLDRGATAAVWQAYDRKLGRNVAIKAFHGDRSSALTQTLAEARSACDVISDHVVRVHDVHDADPAYIVMELVGEHDPARGGLTPGLSAARSKPRDLAEAVRWVRDVARGVHDAHLRNVFHRDLKPHNVLITPISRRAKIADFGLAIRSQSAAACEQVSGLLLDSPAGPCRIVGTPEYMAPEQARGLPVRLDPRDPVDRTTLLAVDVWGLGAVACALFTGAPPWRTLRGPSQERSSNHEAWELAASGAAPQIGETFPDGTRLPARLRNLVRRALALDPKARYADAAELAAELDAYLARRPTSFDRSPWTRGWLWARRNPQLSVTLVVAVILGAMLSATYASVVDLRDERAALEAGKRRLSAEVATARQELEATEGALRDQTASLTALRRALADAQAEYRAIISVKEKALRSADRATKQLAEQLSAARNERDAAENARTMYEALWQRARTEADLAASELSTTELERDTARGERELAVKERDTARAARVRAERERDLAQAEREREEAMRRRLEREIAELAGELDELEAEAETAPTPAPKATTNAGSAAGSAAGATAGSAAGKGAGSGSAVTPPPTPTKPRPDARPPDA